MLQMGGVKAYGMDKLMVGSTMLNTVLVSTEYYVDQYLPAEEGTTSTFVSGGTRVTYMFDLFVCLCGIIDVLIDVL